MMQRQAQYDAVTRGPLPSRDQARDLGRDVGMRRHDPLRLARRAAGEKNHRAAIRVNHRQRDGRVCDKLVVPVCGKPRRSGVSASDTRAAAPVSARTYSSSGRVACSANGTATPPARQMPHSVATHGSPGDSKNAIRSSRRSSRPASSAAAIRVELSSSSA